MTAVRQPRLLSPDEYLELEAAAEMKSEFHDGQVFAMAGGTEPHALLAMQLGAELYQRLKGKPCRVYNSDMKIWIEQYRRFLYPDASALCGPAEFRNATRDVLLNPSLIVEVLSPKTEAYDRGVKLGYYTSVASVREIVLVSQEDVQVDKFTRQDEGGWKFETLRGPEARLHLASVGCELPLGDFYEGIELAPPTPLPPERAG